MHIGQGTNMGLNDNVLENNNNLKYLGTELGRTGGKVHTINIIKCANRAFYSLRGSGLALHSECMSTSLAAHVYSFHSCEIKFIIWMPCGKIVTI